MKPKKETIEETQSAEIRIKEAARKVFQQKGLVGTRTRDIAEAAGLNLALLNYYYRSKEKLFDIIMMESMQDFFKSISEVFNDPKTTFEQKIQSVVARYIDVLTVNPNIPIFVLNELRLKPDEFMSKLKIKETIMHSLFIRQFQEEIEQGKIAPISPPQFIINLLGLTVFPFIAYPIIKNLGDGNENYFHQMMQERKTMIPVWIHSILIPQK